ncbi:hypothetical protein Leryth_013744, partial [Lithospermum erythrorhizon]
SEQFKQQSSYKYRVFYLFLYTILIIILVLTFEFFNGILYLLNQLFSCKLKHNLIHDIIASLSSMTFQ